MNICSLKPEFLSHGSFKQAFLCIDLALHSPFTTSATEVAIGVLRNLLTILSVK